MQRLSLVGIVLAGVLLMGSEPVRAGKLWDKVTSAMSGLQDRPSCCCCQMACDCNCEKPSCCEPVSGQSALVPVKSPAITRIELFPEKSPVASLAAKPAEPTIAKSVTSTQGAMRLWTDISGQHHIEASLLTFANGVVRFQDKDGQILRVDLDKLSLDDQAYVLRVSQTPVQNR